MGAHLVIDSAKYAISVKILAGEGDGTLIYMDARGHIHVIGPGDPGPIRDRVAAAVKHIEAGVTAFHAATAEHAAGR